MERALGRFEGEVQQVYYPFVLNPTSEVATQAACAVAIFAGADAVRVHDVAAAARVAAVAYALRGARRNRP